MNREKTAETKTSPRLVEIMRSETDKEYQDFLHEYLRELTVPKEQSEGFLYIPAKEIKIIPGSATSAKGVIEVHEPEQMVGTEVFQNRDAYEKFFPAKKFAASAAHENRVFAGEINPAPFSPEYGGRFCLTAIPVYETKDGAYVSIPILPDSGQKYGRHAKLGGTSMLRGTMFPGPRGQNEMLGDAFRREVIKSAEIDEKEKGLSKNWTRPEAAPTGLWSVRFYGKSGQDRRYSEIRNCHVLRDPEAGTFELLLIRKQLIIGGLDQIDVYEQSPLERARALVRLENIKNSTEGKPLAIERLYLGSSRIQNLDDLPDSYRGLFSAEKAGIFLKKFQAVPTLRSFKSLEQKVIEKIPGNLKEEAEQEVGLLFEKIVEKSVGTPKNTAHLHVRVPEGRDLESKTEGQPEDFREWARKMAGKDIDVCPDFILSGKTFVEVKTGSHISAKPKKEDQLRRMILYKLATGEEGGVRLFVLGSEGADNQKEIQPGGSDMPRQGDKSSSAESPSSLKAGYPVQAEIFADTEFGDGINPEDLNLMHIWKRKLKK